jgi:nitrite reductase (NADH) small subunit
MPAVATKRIELGVVDDLPLGLGRSFVVGEKTVAVFHGRSGKIFAVDGICPHKGGFLADGMLAGESEQIVCPMHTFRFDPTTGQCDQANVCAITTYPVTVENKKVYLTVPTE